MQREPNLRRITMNRLMPSSSEPAGTSSVSIRPASVIPSPPSNQRWQRAGRAMRGARSGRGAREAAARSTIRTFAAPSTLPSIAQPSRAPSTSLSLESPPASGARRGESTRRQRVALRSPRGRGGPDARRATRRHAVCVQIYEGLVRFRRPLAGRVIGRRASSSIDRRSSALPRTRRGCRSSTLGGSSPRGGTSGASRSALAAMPLP